MNSTDWADPGNFDDFFVRYAEQLHAIHDRMVLPGSQAERAADFLMGLAGRADPSVIELGVGSSRIALRLARRGATVTGVDGSARKLDACRAASKGADLRLVEADIRTWCPDRQADLVCCVAGTLTFLPTPEDRLQAMRVIASAVRPGGAVVIENYDPDYVRALHKAQPSFELKLPVGDAPDHVDARSLLDAEKGVWQSEYRWTEADGTSKMAAERSVLIGPDDVIRMAAEVGLYSRATYGDWTGAPDRLPLMTPTYVCVFSAPDVPAAA